MDYKCITTIKELQEYISNNKLVAFDIETSAAEKFRNDNKAPLDPHKANITGISFSVEQGTAIYVPLSHRVGENADISKMVLWLRDNFFNNGEIIKIAHNLAFETMFFYALGITIAPPVYDTMLASMMTLKSNAEFRVLADSGLKTLVPLLLQVELPKFEAVVGNRFFDELEPQDYETIRYACADSDYTLQLYHLFNDWFDRFLPKHRWIVENIESPTAVFVGIMKYNGAKVDKALMYESQFEAGEKILLLRSQIKEIIGDIDIGENAVTAEFKKYLHDTLNLPVSSTLFLGILAIVISLFVIFRYAPIIHANNIICKSGILKRKMLSRLFVLADSFIIILLLFISNYKIATAVSLTIIIVTISMIIEILKERRGIK